MPARPSPNEERPVDQTAGHAAQLEALLQSSDGSALAASDLANLPLPPNGTAMRHAAAQEPPFVSGASVRATPGPLSQNAAATTLFDNALDAFLSASQKNAPSGMKVPSEIAATAKALVNATRELWGAKGIAFAVEPTDTGTRLVVDNGNQSTLNAFARTLDRRFDETLVFDPLVLWRERAKGSHHLSTREIFLSVDGAKLGAVTQTERHEMLHAFFHHRYQTLGEYSVFNGWVHPRQKAAGDDEERATLFGPGANYTGGYSLEEQAASAFDAAAEVGSASTIVDDMRATGTTRTQAVATLAVVASNLRRHLDTFAGPKLAATSQRAGAALKAGAAVIEQIGLDDATLGHSAFFGREGLSATLGQPPAATEIELVLKRLEPNGRDVVEVRLRDDTLDLNLPFFDASLTTDVTRALAGDKRALSNIGATVGPLMAARANAVTAVANTQVNAWSDLDTAVGELEAALAHAGPSPADPAPLLSALGHVRTSARALRNTIHLGVDVEPTPS